MQQLILTLIALLGLFVPTANSRIAKFFLRFVPPMTTGRVAFEARRDGSTLSEKPRVDAESAQYGTPQMRLGALSKLQEGGEQHTARYGHDSSQCRIRRPQRAAACRTMTRVTAHSRF